MINASSIDGFDYVKEIKQHKFFVCQTDADKSVRKPLVDRYFYLWTFIAYNLTIKMYM